MNRKSALFSLSVALILLSAAVVFADAGQWEEKERELRLILTEAYYRYVSGDVEAALTLVEDYYSGYRRDFEGQVKALISEERAQNIEDWIEYVKASMEAGKSQQEIREDQNDLLRLMRVTANRLDGKEEPVVEKRSWTKTADEMAAVLDKAKALYLSGNPKEAKDQVDVAYFQFYEKVGFEKIVMSSISGARAAQVEYQFSAVKKAINKQSPGEEVVASLDTLTTWLKEDALELDGREENAAVVFMSSLLIIVREVFEAIIIVERS